ncbi:HAMP domain-containing protein [bacterium]|nr:HAMP domain-containing protein [bacterium]
MLRILEVFRFKSFRFRLLFVFLSLFLLVDLCCFLVINSIHRENAKKQIENQLTVSGKVLENIIKNRSDLLLQASYILSKDYAFQQAFSTGDNETVFSAMESLKSRVKADVMLLISIEEDHPVIVDTLKSELIGKPFSYSSLIVAVEETGIQESIFVTILGKLYSVVVVPLLGPDPIGWFCIGFLVDDEFVTDLQKSTLSDISMVELGSSSSEILTDGNAKIFASTLDDSARNAIAAALSKFPVSKDQAIVEVNGDQFIVRIKRLQEKSRFFLVTQDSLNRALQPFFHLRKILFLIAAVGLLVTVCGVFLIARQVTKPVLILSEKAKEIEQGIFGNPVSILQRDEIGELGRTFNKMTTGLAERDKIRDLLGKVVSREIAQELLNSKEIKLGGEEREATILFSDIRNFTTFCENRSPSQVLRMLNHYLTRMNAIIGNSGGVVDKFIGDAIMAVFGVPIHHVDDADRALNAALEMILEMEKINADFVRMGFPEISIGIGINTDIVVAGNMGSTNRLNYTVIGNGVNLASRLESQCKDFKRSIIVSESTMAKSKGNYKTEHLGNVIVKGKIEPTTIYALIEKEC